jgi:hypothetical protein
MEIFDLLKIKTKRELKEFLKDNSIHYKWSFGHVYFKAIYFDISFIVYIDFSYNKIGSFRITMDKEKYSYNEMANNILIIKEKLNNLLGKPKLDNTNHLDYNNIYVLFENDSMKVALICRCIEEYGFATYTVIELYNKLEHVDTKEMNSQLSDAILWIPSMIGGFIWGLAMFASMGAIYGYSLFNFVINMIGGLVFGVAFGSIFALSMMNSKPKLIKTKIRKLIKEYSLENESDLIQGQITYCKQKSSHYFKQYVVPALIKITSIEIIIYSLTKKEQVVSKIPLQEAYYQILNYSLGFNRLDTSYIFMFSNSNNYEKMEKELFNRLINKEEYSSLFSKLKDVTIAYNPYSIYDANGPDILDNEIGIIVKALLVKEDIKELDLRHLIYIAFDHDEYYSLSLTGLYFDEFTKFFNSITINNKN